MRILLFLLITVSVFSQEKLTLITGETLEGEIQKYDSNCLTFAKETEPSPIYIPRTELQRLGFENSQESLGEFTVKLNNGDMLLGNIKSMGEEYLLFESNAIGSIKIPNSHILQIICKGNYQTDRQQWPLPRKNKSYWSSNKLKYDGAIVITAVLECELPSFELIFKRPGFYSSVKALKPVSDKPDSCKIQSVFILNDRKEVKNIKKIPYARNIELKYFLDPIAGHTICEINGVEIKNIKYKSFVLYDTLVIFKSPRESFLEIKDFTIQKWTKDDHIPDQNSALLKNGDLVIWEKLKINNSKLSLRTKLGDVSIPLNLIADLNFKSHLLDKQEPSHLLEGNGMRISGELLSIDGERVVFRNEALSVITINKKFISGIELNKQSKLDLDAPEELPSRKQ